MPEVNTLAEWRHRPTSWPLCGRIMLVGGCGSGKSTFLDRKLLPEVLDRDDEVPILTYKSHRREGWLAMMGKSLFGAVKDDYHNKGNCVSFSAIDMSCFQNVITPGGCCRGGGAASSSRSACQKAAPSPASTGCGDEWLVQNAKLPLTVQLNRCCGNQRNPCVQICGVRVELDFQGEALDHRLEDDNGGRRFPDDVAGYPCEEEILDRVTRKLQNEFCNRVICASSVRDVACQMVLCAQQYLRCKAVNAAVESVTLVSDKGIQYKAAWFHESGEAPRF